MQAWAAVFIAICVQALPFLLLGTVLSAAVAAFVPTSFLERALPKNPLLAVPIAGARASCCRAASAPQYPSPGG